ncbi:hypothetical protein K461DRAFT_268792 [Myriangium duriaei CBS 260.36]|uniref:Uncharacterized protein n=1 Tax=Myriangium duriaei CBS 260.36 TaxID=1168546 RepID=A0A9P4IZ78_9PEZI|nr:hypothetical protein K461DRAFT_268792 [Myriangium duriaei CBS 260.36]
MTARTEVLERANATTDSNNSSPLRGRRGQPSHSSSNSNQTIRATWTGKLFIITGLAPHQNPPSTSANGIKPSQYASPTKSATSRGANGMSKPGSRARNPRGPLKRKRSSINESFADSQDGALTPSDPSQRTSQEGSGSDQDSLSARRDDDDQDSASGDLPATGTNTELPAEGPVRRKRRRRGERLLEQSLAISRPPSPQLPLVSEELDKLLEIDLPPPFLSRSPSPDLDDPNDEASAIYRSLFEPLTKADVFVTALTKINPAQRRTDNLYELAANTAAALRIWQDEYLEIDRRTAPHAPIPRKPATGNRQPLSPTLFEDQKESDIYDYILDLKKLGHQNPIAQKVIRDASGRELRQRAIKGRVTADTQLVNAGHSVSDEEGGRRSRTRKPVSKYDGVAGGGRRKRDIGQLSETVEGDAPAKRGRWGGRGRGGRGRGRGGRGGAALLAKRIREMREASAVTATSASADDDSASENGAYETYSREGSAAPSREMLSPGQMDFDDQLNEHTGLTKRKGRPKGSKNLHVRSDKGIPKGPRQPKAGTGDSQLTSPSRATSQAGTTAASSGKATGSQTPRTGAGGRTAPKSEKRSESMTAWWARRKAAAAEAKRQAAEAAGQAAPPVEPKGKAEKTAEKQETKSAASQQYIANQGVSQAPVPSTVPSGSPYTAPQRFSNGPSPSQGLPPVPHQPHLQQPHGQVPHYAQSSPLPPYAAPATTAQYHSPLRQPAYPLPPMSAASPQTHHAFPHQPPDQKMQGLPPPPPQFYHDPRYDPQQQQRDRDRELYRQDNLPPPPPHGYPGQGYPPPPPGGAQYMPYHPPGGYAPPGQPGPPPGQHHRHHPPPGGRGEPRRDQY